MFHTSPPTEQGTRDITLAVLRHGGVPELWVTLPRGLAVNTRLRVQGEQPGGIWKSLEPLSATITESGRRFLRFPLSYFHPKATLASAGSQDPKLPDCCGQRAASSTSKGSSLSGSTPARDPATSSSSGGSRSTSTPASCADGHSERGRSLRSAHHRYDWHDGFWRIYDAGAHEMVSFEVPLSTTTASPSKSSDGPGPRRYRGPAW